MAITEESLRLARALRIRVDDTVDNTTRQLVEAWARAWNELTREWEDATADLIAAAADGRWPSRRAVLRSESVTAALARTRDALEELAKTSGVTITGTLPSLTDWSAKGQADVLAAQLPRHGGPALAKVDPDALTKIVERTAQQITALHRPLAADAERAMKSSLIRGVAVGDNPRVAAADMLARVKGGFDGGLNRALVIARTEMLDAHRNAAHAAEQANTDLLAGWEWLCALDRRTCPGCWSMHGRRFPTSQAGPEDHQQGRCTRVPTTLSWKELGIDVPEPASAMPDARAVFDALPQKDRVAVMGARRLELLDSGAIDWDALAVKRSTPGWRDSWAPASVKDLTG